MGIKNGMFGKLKESAVRVSIHQYLRKYYPPPKKCELCGEEKKLELACKDGKYIRDIKEYFYICHKCHSEYDGYVKYLEIGHHPKDYEKLENIF